MRKILETSLDYRKAADEIWDKARTAEELGHYELALILKDISDSLHDLARKKNEEEQLLKNSN